MLDSSDSEGNTDFKINEDFAKKYEYQERRKALEKGKKKFGKEVFDAAVFSKENEVEYDSESSSSEDDSEAELLNPKLETKFLEVLTAIRNNDPKLKETKTNLFNDEDFEVNQKEAKEKSFTLKDQIRSEVLKKMNKNEGSESSEDSDSSSDNEENN